MAGSIKSIDRASADQFRDANLHLVRRLALAGRRLTLIGGRSLAPQDSPRSARERGHSRSRSCRERRLRNVSANVSAGRPRTLPGRRKLAEFLPVCGYRNRIIDPPFPRHGRLNGRKSHCRCARILCGILLATGLAMLAELACKIAERVADARGSEDTKSRRDLKRSIWA